MIVIFLDWNTLDHIQTECSEALRLWKYRKINQKFNKKMRLEEIVQKKKLRLKQNLNKLKHKKI